MSITKHSSLKQATFDADQPSDQAEAIAARKTPQQQHSDCMHSTAGSTDRRLFT
jgi:hypothetical protein